MQPFPSLATELSRHDWRALRARRDARVVPAAIRALLSLLVEICAGEPAAEELASRNAGIVSACVHEVSHAYSYLVGLLSSPTPLERIHSFDLIAMCAESDSELAVGAVPHLERAIELSSEADRAALREWVRSIRTMR